LPVLVFQEALVELAGWVSRKFLTEVDGSGALNVGQTFTTIRDEFD
jgi:hypothetical protein